MPVAGAVVLGWTAEVAGCPKMDDVVAGLPNPNALDGCVVEGWVVGREVGKVVDGGGWMDPKGPPPEEGSVGCVVVGGREPKVLVTAG
jgi:hypothetical protein